jgi:hypothetical protein
METEAGGFFCLCRLCVRRALVCTRILYGCRAGQFHELLDVCCSVCLVCAVYMSCRQPKQCMHLLALPLHV